LYQRENEKEEESDEVCRGRESTKKEKLYAATVVKKGIRIRNNMYRDTKTMQEERLIEEQ
jgi:hypothetical protein